MEFNFLIVKQTQNYIVFVLSFLTGLFEHEVMIFNSSNLYYKMSLGREGLTGKSYFTLPNLFQNIVEIPVWLLYVIQLHKMIRVDDQVCQV